MNIALQFLDSACAFLAEAAPAAAETATKVASGFTYPDHLLTALGACLGAGLACLSVALGIGRIASSSVESIARQPEASGDIRGAMILTCAFIEGVCLFAVVVALLAVGKIPSPPA